MRFTDGRLRRWAKVRWRNHYDSIKNRMERHIPFFTLVGTGYLIFKIYSKQG